MAQTSDNDRFYARYTQGGYERWERHQAAGVPTLHEAANVTETYGPNKSLALSWVRTFSPTLFNDVLVSVSREVAGEKTGELGRRYADELGLPNPFGAEGWPKLDATGALSGYRFWSTNARRFPYVYGILQDNATKIQGRHEFQFGLHYRYDQLNFLPDQQQSQGRDNWSTLATALYDPKSSRTNPLALPQTGQDLANMFLGVTNYLNQFERGYGVLAWSGPQQSHGARVPEGRGVSLFNGSDLTGWKTSSSHWVVEDGTLLLKGRHDGTGRPDSYIWTEETFGDFILDVDFKIPEGRANSGIFIRVENPKKPVQTGIEVSIANLRPDGALDKNSVGGIYNLVAPKKNVFRPGEWNHYRITCRGRQIVVELNGELASEADLDFWAEPQMNPDGTRNKFTRPLKDFARRGHIGFQDHGTLVSFRNIRIKRLDD